MVNPSRWIHPRSIGSSMRWKLKCLVMSLSCSRPIKSPSWRPQSNPNAAVSIQWPQLSRIFLPCLMFLMKTWWSGRKEKQEMKREQGLLAKDRIAMFTAFSLKWKSGTLLPMSSWPLTLRRLCWWPGSATRPLKKLLSTNLRYPFFHPEVRYHQVRPRCARPRRQISRVRFCGVRQQRRLRDCIQKRQLSQNRRP